MQIYFYHRQITGQDDFFQRIFSKTDMSVQISTSKPSMSDHMERKISVGSIDLWSKFVSVMVARFLQGEDECHSSLPWRVFDLFSIILPCA